MNELFPITKSERPGFRLHKLEVYNWGTFDSSKGSVYTVRTDGQMALLIGRNGSGKSTLVDALLTLLVRPGVRNYNVAAGAKKRERDERSYIKGAFDRRSRESDNKADTQYLRPGNSHYSCLLACFRNEDSLKSFTVALILYVNADGKAERVYCFSPDERSIAADCAGLTSMEKLRQQMQKRGFKATANYTEYTGWFAKATGMRRKAMDMFNQTVAVKDIESLNTFIRDHMLESRPWSERVDSLLNHFTQLSQAHQSLVKVRRQRDLLQPICEYGTEYSALAQDLKQTEELLDAADAYFRQKTIDLFEPARQLRKTQLEKANVRQEELANSIADSQNECRRLMNEIENAGGERLKQIPLLIRAEESGAASKRAANLRFHSLLRTAQVQTTLNQTGDQPTGVVSDGGEFESAIQQLPELTKTLTEAIAKKEAARDERMIKRGEINRNLHLLEDELAALQKRQTNLPESFSQLRNQMCRDLRINEKEIPFAAELIAVKADEREWESSIEKVLNSFALSLLVPEKHYRVVSGYIDKTRLVDARGRGQRLVYLKVGQRKTAAGPVLNPQSLIRKLTLRDGHALLPWVKGELEQRFDYRCCDTMDDFRATNGLALTRERHVKTRGNRHEKDDRDRATNPRFFVLGWDNREKKQHLAAAVKKYRDASEQLSQTITKLESDLSQLRSRETAIAGLTEFASFSEIDFAANERAISSLRLEETTLKDGNETIKLLETHLAEAQSKASGLTSTRDEVVGDIKMLTSQIKDAERLIENAKRRLEQQTVDHSPHFAALDDCFADDPLTDSNIIERESAFVEARRKQHRDQSKKLDPVQGRMMKAMNRFLRDFPDERSDLDAAPESLVSFNGLFDRIAGEDLPRHEERFKERLNEKVTQEIGFLNGSLQQEATEIKSRIDVLNRSLKQLEYRDGTYMRLDPRPVRDREIMDFKAALNECLSHTFEGTIEADEARYLQIQKLITRLREEERWRKKVTDVRRWFDFAAIETDAETEGERSCYTDSAGQSGGEKAKLAFTILVAAIAYQYDIDPDAMTSDRFHFVVVDEMFSKVDDKYSEYALELFKKFGLQLLIVAPLDSKARVTEPYVGCYLHVVKNETTNHSEIFSMTAREFEDAVV